MPSAPTTAALGAALTLAGLGFGIAALLVPGVGLIGLAVVAVAWVELACPRRLLRYPGPPRVVEDEPFELRIRTIGARIRPPGGELADPVLAAPVPVGPGWDGTLEAEVRLSRRGRHRLAPPRLVIRDPLGLRRRAVSGSDPGELLVLPRIAPVLAAGGGAGGASGTISGVGRGAPAGQLEAHAIELEIDGLRAYREGSPASRIHWPAVARTGDLIERRLVSGADAAPLVVLDSSRPASADALDAAVRAAASLCVHLARRGGCSALLPGDRRATEIEPDLRAWPTLHARLALVEPAGSSPAIARVLRSGAVFWVTARAPAGARSALAATGPAPSFVVAPEGSWRGEAAFTVAGCVGRRIGARTRRAGVRAA